MFGDTQSVNEYGKLLILIYHKFFIFFLSNHCVDVFSFSGLRQYKRINVPSMTKMLWKHQNRCGHLLCPANGRQRVWLDPGHHHECTALPITDFVTFAKPDLHYYVGPAIAEIAVFVFVRIVVSNGRQR